jgi:hypothetical protein
MRGRPPKDNPQDGGARRSLEWTELGATPIPEEEREELGRKPGGGRWTTYTRRWWKVWAESPMASRFIGTDWEHLRKTAMLVDEYIRQPTPAGFRAIEHAESMVGGTISARLQLRLRVHQRGQVGEERPAEERPQLRRVAGDPRLALVKGAEE